MNTAQDETVAPKNRSDQVRLTEIFLSLQGESTSVGLPTVFVRLTGCPLRCTYCDTAYAFHGGSSVSIEAVLEEVGSHGTRHVTVTGGEPLAQPGVLPLMTALCDAGYSVSIETSGALDVAEVDSRVRKVLDLKTPGSGPAMHRRLVKKALLRGDRRDPAHHTSASPSRSPDDRRAQT